MNKWLEQAQAHSSQGEWDDAWECLYNYEMENDMETASTEELAFYDRVEDELLEGEEEGGEEACACCGECYEPCECICLECKQYPERCGCD